MQKQSLLRNEDGSIMVIALVLLVLLTFLGMSATTTSTIEVQIARNDRLYKQNFYLAEGAALLALQRLDDAAPANMIPGSTTFTWLKTSAVDMADPVIMLANDQPLTGIDTNASYGVTSSGIASGASLSMTASTQLYDYTIYGLYSGNGQNHIAMGYRKRF